MGPTIGYDVLVFDKEGNVAYIEVKSSASYSRRWVLQKKYATPDGDSYHLSLDFKPQHRTKEEDILTVGERIGAESFLENCSTLGIVPVSA